MTTTRQAKITPEHLAESAKLKALWQEASHGLTQAEFGQTFEIGSQAAVGFFLNGKSPISMKAARGFAKGLGCTIDAFSPRLAREASQAGALTGLHSPPHKGKADATGNVVPVSIGVTRIPLISHVQAGLWTEVVDSFSVGDAEDWLLTDQKVSTAAFALEIKGDSMLPEFKPGDRVIIDPEVLPQPGDFVVAKNGEEEATFKKYRPRGYDASGNNVFELVPLNEDFASIRSDQQPIRIVGTMVEHRKYRKR